MVCVKQIHESVKGYKGFIKIESGEKYTQGYITT